MGLCRGVKIIKAMAAGVPVIATDVGVVRELMGGCGIQNAPLEACSFEIGQHGALVTSGDARGFAKGLQYLLERPGLWREMGQRGREYALKHHSKDRLIADMNRLCNRSRGGVFLETAWRKNKGWRHQSEKKHASL